MPIVTDTTAETPFKKSLNTFKSSISVINDDKNSDPFQNKRVIKLGSKITATAKMPNAPTPVFKSANEEIVTLRLSAMAPPTTGIPFTK